MGDLFFHAKLAPFPLCSLCEILHPFAGNNETIATVESAYRE
jgi:hypothetical protein